MKQKKKKKKRKISGNVIKHLGTSLLEHPLTGKGRTRTGEGTIRKSQDF